MSARRLVFVGSDAPEPFYLEEINLPELPEGCILAKIRMATICGSDLHTISGRRKPAIPTILGHEGVAEIVETRRKDSPLKTGDRITFQVANCCSKCEHCNRGLQQKCNSLFKYGQSLLGAQSPLNGCYATHIVLHPGTFCVPLPANVPDSLAATVNCALATVVNVAEELGCSDFAPGIKRSVVIQGSGMLGLYACALLRESGFSDVYCLDTVESRLDLAKKFGANTICIGKNDADLPADNSVDAVIEICGVPSVFQQGIRLLRPGGSYMLVGLVHPDSQLDVRGDQIIRKCLTIKGVHNYSSRHLSSAVDFISRTVDKYPYGELFSELYSLQDFKTAFDLALSRKYLRVCIKP